MLYVLAHSLLRNFYFLVSGSSHPIHDDVSCQFDLWSPYITSGVFFFSFMTFICFEGLRYVPRKEKNTSSTRDSYCIFVGRGDVAKFIAKNVLTY